MDGDAIGRFEIGSDGSGCLLIFPFTKEKLAAMRAGAMPASLVVSWPFEDSLVSILTEPTESKESTRIMEIIAEDYVFDDVIFTEAVELTVKGGICSKGVLLSSAKVEQFLGQVRDALPDIRARGKPVATLFHYLQPEPNVRNPMPLMIEAREGKLMVGVRMDVLVSDSWYQEVREKAATMLGGSGNILYQTRSRPFAVLAILEKPEDERSYSVMRAALRHPFGPGDVKFGELVVDHGETVRMRIESEALSLISTEIGGSGGPFMYIAHLSR